MQGDKKLQWVLNDLKRRQIAARKKQRALEDSIARSEALARDLSQYLFEIEGLVPDLEAAEAEIKHKANEFANRKEKQARQLVEDEKKRCARETKRLERELAQYRSRELLEISTEDHQNQARLKYDLNRATTLAIYDSIISAIGNWSADGQIADDFEMLLQSILFPLVYEPVVSGDEDYFLTSVPVAAYEVVKRGREYVKHYRTSQNVIISSDPFLWDEARDEIKNWLVKDALPMMYEVGSEDWANVQPVDIKDMWKWKEQPMARALEFPLIFDGMELVTMLGDKIRQEVDLASFTLTTMKTRIEP